MTNTEPTCHTGNGYAVGVEVSYEFLDAGNEHVDLLATFDDGREPVRLTFDPDLAREVAKILLTVDDSWQKYRSCYEGVAAARGALKTNAQRKAI